MPVVYNEVPDFEGLFGFRIWFLRAYLVFVFWFLAFIS